MTFDRQRTVSTNYFELIVEKLKKLKEHASKLDKDVLQDNPHLLKQIMGSISLRFRSLLS